MRTPAPRPPRPSPGPLVGGALALAAVLSLVVLAALVLRGPGEGLPGDFGAPARTDSGPGVNREVPAAPVLIPRPAPEPTPREDEPGRAPRQAFESWERERIARHLEAVELEMRSRDLSGLTPAQREARARHLQALAEYRIAGDFPRNVGHPGALVPYFVDDRGVHCAVGYLLHRSGQEPLVQRIAAERNHATVPELADEPALVSWLEDAGITLEEAARIQPAYCGGDPESCWGFVPWESAPEPKPEAGPTAYRAVSAGLLSVQGVALGWNLVSLLRGDPSGWTAALALGAGTAGFGVGAHGVGADHTRGLGIVNLGAGVATLTGGILAYAARDRPSPIDWEALPAEPSGSAPIGTLATAPSSGPPVGEGPRDWHPPFRPLAPGR